MVDDEFRHYLLINGKKRYVYSSVEEMPEEIRAEHDAWWAAEVAAHKAFKEEIAREIVEMLTRALNKQSRNKSF